MIIGKDDQTKDYKMYLPRDRIVIVVQHVQNVETHYAPGNEQLQAQLRREGPELGTLEANGTWEVVAKRSHAKRLHSKLVFKTKKHAGGTLEKFKASAALEGLSAMLAVSRKINVPARHGDVLNAYVRTDKESDLEILLHMPRGMMVDTKPLADLEKTGGTEVTQKLRGNGSGLTVVGVYVIDLLVKGTSVANVDKFFEDMNVLEVKDLGPVSKFVSIGIV
ncbi:putative mitochondrial protein [Phytophthora cinnamomi]|uniref:putative mitochondrial protein n=1 Tax=Phytophthora cinnamomi TaxID=4785 RepID=UPI00355A4B80|nr:putative mitochondrial protein [Phytophthora cinnamomi]